MNLYGFVFNSPLAWHDVVGRDPEGAAQRFLTEGGSTGEEWLQWGEKVRRAKRERAAKKLRNTLKNDLYDRMSKLCPAEGECVEFPGKAQGGAAGAGWAHPQKCERESCLKQAEAYAAKMSELVTLSVMAETEEHPITGVLSGGWGNILRFFSRPDPGSGQVGDGHGMACSDWQACSLKAYNNVLGKYGEGGTLCFRGAAVFKRCRLKFWDREAQAHHFFALYGPMRFKSKSGKPATVDAARADIVIDPWAEGDAIVPSPSKTRPIEGIDQLTRW